MCIQTFLKFESSHDVHFGKDMLYTVIPSEGAVDNNWHLVLYKQSISCSYNPTSNYDYKSLAIYYVDIKTNSLRSVLYIS